MTTDEEVKAAVEDFLNEKLTQVVLLLNNEITNEARKQDLKSDRGGNQYLQSFKFRRISKDEWELYNDTPYAAYLEYGTLDYFRLFGTGDFPRRSGLLHPKKTKPTPLPERIRATLPKGMQPFAVYRKTIFNPEIVKSIIKKVLV